MSTADKTLAQIFHVDEMSEADRVSFYERIGSVLVDVALGRLLTSLNEAELQSLKEQFETLTPEDNAVEYLMSVHPQFEQILIEEAAIFQARAQA